MVHTRGTPPNAQRSRCHPSSAHSDSAVSASSHSRDPGSTRRCSQLSSCRAKTSARRPRNPCICTNGSLAQRRGDESFSKVPPQRASFAPSSRLLPLGDRYGVADGRVVLAMQAPRVAIWVRDAGQEPGGPEPRVDDPRAAPYLREGEGNSYPWVKEIPVPQRRTP